MKFLLIPLALLVAAPVLAQAPQAPEGPQRPLTLNEHAALKCSAAFALAAGKQGAGRAALTPAQASRAKEFFVRTSASVMDTASWPRERVAGEIGNLVKSLQRPGELEAAMPPCLLLLDASGL